MTTRKRSKGRPKGDRRHASRAGQASAIDISIRATVLDHLRDLERENDPHLVEHMVSALLGFALNLGREAAAEFQRRLKDTLVKMGSPTALLSTEAIADQAPAGWDVTPWLDELRRRGVQQPPWAGLPRRAFLGAWKGTELLGDQDMIILPFMTEGERAESFQGGAISFAANRLAEPRSGLVVEWRSKPLHI